MFKILNLSNIWKQFRTIKDYNILYHVESSKFYLDDSRLEQNLLKDAILFQKIMQFSFYNLDVSILNI